MKFNMRTREEPEPEDRRKRCFFRCRCCTHGVLCASCIVRTHAFSPLHDIEEWTGEFFERRLLRDLGLVWSLRHPGASCPEAEPGKTRLISVATENGYRCVRVQYCRCEGRCRSTDEHGEAVQLLEAGLWPVTLKSPQSAISFGALENFSHHWNADKKSAYSYCTAIRAMTDSLKLWLVPVRPFIRRLLALVDGLAGYVPRVQACCAPLEDAGSKKEKRAGSRDGQQGADAKAWDELCVLPCMPRGGLQHIKGVFGRCERGREVSGLACLWPWWLERFAMLMRARRHKYTLFQSTDGTFNCPRCILARQDEDDCAMMCGSAFCVEDKRQREFIEIAKKKDPKQVWGRLI